MQKAFDVSDLEARLKAQGLPAIEGLAKIVSNELFGWLSDSFAVIENPLLKAIGPAAILVLKPLADGAIDKIDGKEG